MMRYYLGFYALLLAAFCTAQTAEETTLETETGDLFGTLLLPENDFPHTVALIISGSGPTDRDGNNPQMKNNALKMLAEVLAQNNIASLRYDKRGVAASAAAAGAESELRFDHYIDDAKAWIKKLAADERFDSLVVIGHSEGALIGAKAAQREEVDKFVSIAGAGNPAAQIIKDQISMQAPMFLDQTVEILDTLEQGHTTDSIPQALYRLFRPSVQPYMISWFQYNPQEEIAKLEKPVLIVQGTTDIQVEVKDARLLAKANPDAQLEIIEGMNHVLKPSSAERNENMATYTNPDLGLKPELMEKVVSFIR
jgi:pimeloyl-ACP methyl ester carboxylesterase